MPEGTTPSTQDYLRVLLTLSQDGEGIRSARVAKALGYSRASVSQAMDALQRQGYVTRRRYGPVALTLRGRQAAREMKRRYDLLTTLLIDVLGIAAIEARAEACRLEHAISEPTADRMARYLKDRAKQKEDI